MRAAVLFLGTSLSALAGCEHAPVRAVLYETFSLLPASVEGEHYERFGQVNGVSAPIGCFVVEKRQIDCFDSNGAGEPNDHLAVVECTCPCDEQVDDPCDPDRPPVRAGTVRGLVDEEGGALTRGGVETPTDIDLAQAGYLYVRRVPEMGAPEVILGGPLVRDGSVLLGRLRSPTNQPVTCLTTVVPVVDGVSL